MALGLFIASQVQAKVKTKDINFPGKFYTTEITFCKAMKDTPTFTDSFSIKKVKGLIGYDWHADWEANSTSMNLQSKRIRVPIEVLMAGTQNAISNNNQANIDIAKNLLIDLAKADTLYDSIGYNEVQKKPMCYAGGDVNAPCWYHQYAFARDVFSNYMITALWLKDELNEQEFKTVNLYIKKMYKKFIKPVESKIGEQGFYQMANGGTGIGKTWFTLEMLCSIATGQSFLGKYNVVNPKPVIYIDGEMPFDSIRERINLIMARYMWQIKKPSEIKIHLSNPFLWEKEKLSSPKINNKNIQDLLHREIKELSEHYDSSLFICFDNLSCLTDYKENDNDDWTKMLDFYTTLKTEGHSICHIHHVGKSGDQRGAS